MTDLIALIRRNPVECAVIALTFLAAWAGSPWTWEALSCVR
jgi:hypothetical protein